MVDKEKRAARERTAMAGESYTTALRKVREPATVLVVVVAAVGADLAS